MIVKLLLDTQMIWMIVIKNIKQYNPNKNYKIFIVFDYMIPDMLRNKKT